MLRTIQVYKETTEELGLNPSGTINQQNLLFAKQTLLFDTVRQYASDLVYHKQGYPNDGYSDVHLECDFVIVDKREYDQLIRYKEDSQLNIKI